MNIFIMALEPLETRYTGQWFHAIPKLLQEAADAQGREVTVFNVAGTQTSTVTTEGAFLNFTATNIWKNTQINTLAEYFSDGTVQEGDKILFTDAWHTGVIQAKYMSDLTGIPVEIHSMWHAGSYDPNDFLGRAVKDKEWSYAAERSYFFASNKNYFATEYHRDLFMDTLLEEYDIRSLFYKTQISGQPHAALVSSLEQFKGMTKRDVVLFPHRVAPEKQPEIFRDLAAAMPDVEFIVCQEQNLTKDEYHKLLGEAKIIFSANLQETLGISAMEGILVDAIPMLPDRLSYTEMYADDFLYPSVWTESWQAYQLHKNHVIKHIRKLLSSNSAQGAIDAQRKVLLDKYLNANVMINKLIA